MLQKGIGASRGKALGKALMVQEPPKITADIKRVCSEEESIQKTDAAILAVRSHMETLEAKYLDNKEDLKLEITQMQKAMVTDSLFYKNICRHIAGGSSAESAVWQSVEEQCQALEAIGDAYLAERAEDFKDVGNRLVCQIMGISYPDVSTLDHEVILVGENIPPSLLVNGDGEHIKGLLLTKGSRTAHVCILAANMGIPAVVGCQKVDGLLEGETVFLDGNIGYARYGMNQDELDASLREVESYQEETRMLLAFRDKEAVTQNGVRVEVLANIMDANGTDKLLEAGADGVGLFRTEFLYMDRKKLPLEAEQFSIYKSAAKKLGELPLTIRTMDIGGDKEVEALNLPKEENPFLGYRAIRICLDQREIFTQQLRAILRAGAYGTVKLMFPMISSMEELDQALRMLEEVKGDLQREGEPCDPHILVGMMVEVPSVAVMASQFIRKVDFFSIGSNDLTQYLLAVDRQNEKVADLYDYFHPGVLAMIANTIRACDEAGKPCSLCGEMASDPLAIPLLLGMGLRKFSVNPSSVLMVKYLLSLSHTEILKELAEKALTAESGAQVKQMVRDALGDTFGLWL